MSTDLLTLNLHGLKEMIIENISGMSGAEEKKPVQRFYQYY